MMEFRSFKTLLLGTALLAGGGVPFNALGCAACFGKSDSAMAQGMNMGIFTLLGVIVTVLLGVAGFFIFLARRGEQPASAVPSRETLGRIQET
jgi:hypothetical protein